jgi:RNA polymerase sigma-70 factor (ECF subfamily)
VFVTHHQDLVYGMARRWTTSSDDARDVAQDALIRAWRAIERYDRERLRSLQVRGWLAAIVRNVARNRARDEGPSHDALETAGDPEDLARARPEQAALAREAAREWAVRLARLPERQRVAIELRHVHGLSYPEMAVALGRPVNTVKSDVHRGVLALREALGELEVAR